MLIFPSARPGNRLALVEMAEYGGAFVSAIAFLDIHPGSEKRITSGSIDDERPLISCCVPSSGRYGRDDCFGGKCDIGHAGALNDFDTLGGCVFEQDMIEFRTPNLKRIIQMPMPSIGESEEARIFMMGGHKFDSELRHPDLFDLFANAQSVEERHIGRQQRFTDMKARVAVLIDQDHGLPALGKQRRDGGAGWSSADDDDVAGGLGEAGRTFQLVLPEGLCIWNG